MPEAYEFLPEKFFPRLVYGSARVRAFLLCLEPGQELAPRADSEEMMCFIVEGRAKLTIGDEVHEVSAGDFAAAGPGEVRGIEVAEPARQAAMAAASGGGLATGERCVALWVHVSAGRPDDG